MKIDINQLQVNEIVIEALKEFYVEVYEDECNKRGKYDTLLSIDDVLSYFMTPNEYEDFANGICEDARKL